MYFNLMKYLIKCYSYVKYKVENKVLYCSKFELINIVVMSGENLFLLFVYVFLN